MPQVAYVTVNGVRQGLITAGCNTQDHTDESTVLQFEHQMIIPRDPQTGQPTGQRVHKPLVYRTRYDKTTPLMNKALCTGERLSEVVIKWYRTIMEGTQEYYFTHTLTDAIIVDIKAETTLATDNSLDYRDHEVVYSLVYRKIKWEHVVAGTSGDPSGEVCYRPFR
ncbi:hypothetical protein PN36_28310 [Candidatus Thiomargarita nelsonii]|uniref:Major exported protein n=1 Tax=Candidatus Thiomargarita nelsonii TaxID=1003181 RepID=A0A4E0QZF3_9GAMM|nr:hypothetical protein PN36_28310 [Candidatus Thiomargarita nelsonii]